MSKAVTIVFRNKHGARSDGNGFVDVKDVFLCPWFNGNEERTEEYIEYCAELNLKHGWTLDTVFEILNEGIA